MKIYIKTGVVIIVMLTYLSANIATAQTNLITSSIRSIINDTSVRLLWETHTPSLTWLTYGTSIQFGQEHKSTNYSTTHSVDLLGLTPGTNFYYHIITEDEQGVISPDTVPTLYSTFQTVGIDDIAILKARLADLQLRLSILQKTAGIKTNPTTISLTRTLKQGDTGEDVKKLQQLLNKDVRTRVSLSGAGSLGFETNYFGSKTRQAVVIFQELYPVAVLKPVGLIKGSGIVGPLTIAHLNTLYDVTASPVIAPAESRVAAIAQAPDVVNNQRGGWIGVSQGGGGSSGTTGTTNNTSAQNSSNSASPSTPASPATPASPVTPASPATPTPPAIPKAPTTPTPPIIPVVPPAPQVITSPQSNTSGYGPIAITPLAQPDYYITVTGGGTHTGSQANPFSLSEAQGFANKTENLNRSLVFSLAAGEYGTFIEKTTRGRNAWITYQGADPDNKPIFRGNALSDAIYIRNTPSAYILFTGISAYNNQEIVIEVENANYVTIRDSYIEGGRSSSSVGYAVRAFNANQFTLQNSVIRYGSNGISTYGTDDLTVINNEFVGQLIDGGHFSDTNGFVIMGNNFRDGSDPNNIYPDSHVDGVQFHATEGGIKNGLFANNRIANYNGQGLFMSHSNSLPVNIIDSIIIKRNLITGSYLASPFQIEGENLTVIQNTVDPQSPIVSLLTEKTNKSTVKDNLFTASFLNCSKNSTQDHNLISRYINFGCNGQNVPVGVHDVTGETIQLDSSGAPTVDQTFTTTAGMRVTGCMMSSTSGAVGSQLCEAIENVNPVTTPTQPTPETSEPTVVPKQATPSSNLIGYWSFDASETTNGITTDLSGQNHDGTLINSPSSVSGHRNEGLSFNDASSQSVRIDAANSVLNQGSGSYTISAWINPSDMSAFTGSHFGAGIIKSIGNSGNGSQGDFYLAVDKSGELVFTNWQSSGDVVNGRHYVDLSNPVNTEITANQWYHVAATWNGSVNNMYINGQPQTFITTNTDGGYKAATTIGSLINGAAHWQWSGGIDEVKLFNRALSDSEITSLYNDTFSTNYSKSSSFLASIWEVFLRLFHLK